MTASPLTPAKTPADYISTRGHRVGGFREAIVAGLAPDGGLVVPAVLPDVADDLERWRDLDYATLATEVIARFATDVPYETIAALCAKAYAPEAFAVREVVPLRPLGEELTLVGLSEGPTLAFKDLAMRFLAEALDLVLTERGEVLNILGATSGDTGSAAEYAIRGRERIAAFMLSPRGRMSAFQRAQMYSLQEHNIHNIVVDGVFDDCQDLVKRLTEDAAFKAQHRIGAVNSINFGRIVAQIAYYVWAWLRATDGQRGNASAAVVDIAVPSGNFGNILSGHFARRMGVPIRRLILATNENNVLHECFDTGIYRPRSAAATHVTSSPSMDVSKASNFERFVFDLFGGDADRTAAAWSDLAATGELDLTAERHRFRDEFGIVSGTSTHADRIATIRRCSDEHGVVIDPHTADGVHVAAQYREPGVPMLVLETAKPEKFAATIEEALGEAPIVTAEHRALLDAPQRTTSIPAEEAALRLLIAERALR